MAFKRTLSPTFSALVTVPVPNDKGGHDKNTFTAIFKRTPTDELPRFQGMSDADLVRDRLTGWELVDEETKQPVPFSPDELEAVLQIQPAPRFIALAFFDHVRGGKG